MTFNVKYLLNGKEKQENFDLNNVGYEIYFEAIYQLVGRFETAARIISISPL